MRFAVAALLPVLALTGCALTSAVTPTPEMAPGIQGAVHGGQQPVIGAHIYLFAAGNTGYGGAGIGSSSANASTSLLSASVTGLSDAVGAYVLTGPGGSFNLPAYSCTPGTQIYLYALGGNPGAGTNSASSLLAILGQCPASGNLGTAVPFVIINEVSTVAAAYAFAGFASDATHVGSSGTALAQTGIANAFLNAGSLINIPTGTALATTPAGNGIVPQAEINTLANILASCVNTNDSNGSISRSCTTLFGLALSGGATGTAPTDTATAAINIAHNPAANVAALYVLPTPAAPFPATGYGQPNDFTVGINFTGGGLQGPDKVAVDAAGNIWVANIRGHSLSKYSSAGVPLSPSTGFGGGGMDPAGGGTTYPYDMTIDVFGNVWTSFTRGIGEFTNNGVALSPATGYDVLHIPAANGGTTFIIPSNIAQDGNGNAYVTDGYYQDNSITEFSDQVILSISPGPEEECIWKAPLRWTAQETYGLLATPT